MFRLYRVCTRLKFPPRIKSSCLLEKWIYTIILLGSGPEESHMALSEFMAAGASTTDTEPPLSAGAYSRSTRQTHPCFQV